MTRRPRRGKTRRRAVVLLCLLPLLAAALLFAQGSGGGATVPERALGLSKTTVFEIPSPEPVGDNPAEPGDAPPLPRAYPGAPPRVPHAVADLLPITRDENLCVDCHLLDEAEEGDPTPIPESHYVDLRNAPAAPGEALVGARHVCVTCHLPTTGAPPLVGNRFAAAAVASAEPAPGEARGDDQP